MLVLKQMADATRSNVPLTSEKVRFRTFTNSTTGRVVSVVAKAFARAREGESQRIMAIASLPVPCAQRWTSRGIAK